MLLEKYRDQARAAFMATSFSPDKRGDQLIKDYSEELENDLKELEKRGSVGEYQGKYEVKFIRWISAMGRCMSPMITGPANFPVAKNARNRDREQNRYTEFRKWRELYFKSVYRERTLSPEEEIDKALEDLDKQIIAHEIMKRINKIVRSKKTPEEKISEMVKECGIKEKSAKELITPDDCGRLGFASYALTNSNAKIKRLEQKLETMRARVQRKETWEPIPFPGGEIDLENDRVIIRHEEKPSREVIDSLKSKGFRWSRSYGSWSRKHTGNAVAAARKICGV
jgi:hypothetical protein